MCSALYIPVLMGPGLSWTWKAQRLGETLALVLDKEPLGPLSLVLRALLQARPFWALGAASLQGTPLPLCGQGAPRVCPCPAPPPPTVHTRCQNLLCLSCSRVSLPNPLWPACPHPHPMLTYDRVRPPTEPFNHPQSKATPQAQATGRKNKTR